jgi:hypothetical protein
VLRCLERRVKPAEAQGIEGQDEVGHADLPTHATALAFAADGRLLVAGRDRTTLIGPTGVEVIGSMTLRVVR